ncbi:uncharacterized protein LOC127845534 isoform X2 [Dreissena polymorpha]|uniref:uncharacterized protein LOC127845534 isoform X2 n=1 Tax=Dreissena polymorpha TaxID=45954 RepID=UPI002263F2C5|nr:uncharacterized protein LOC127845534 isoform X2 [Dreissena polymorpha]
MTSLSDVFTEKERTNWLKALLAIDIAKTGLEQFVDNEARAIGRTVRHSLKCKVTDQGLQDIFTTLTSLLNDQICLANDVAAQEAVRKLTELQNDRISIEELGELLNEAYRTLKHATEAGECILSAEAERTFAQVIFKHCLKEKTRDGEQPLTSQKHNGQRRFKRKTKAGLELIQRKSYDAEECLESKIKDGTQQIEYTMQDRITSMQQAANTTSQIEYEREKAEIPRAHATEYEPVFIGMEYKLETFLIFQYSLETIKGICTICKQDLPNASRWLDDRVVSANSVLVCTTEEISQNFPIASKKQKISTVNLAENINKAKGFALVVIDTSLQETVVEALETSDIRNTGLLIVGDVDELPALPNVHLSHTQSSTILTDADCLLERCAFAVLSKVYMDMKLHFSNTSRSEQEKRSLRDIYDMISASFKRSGVPKDEWQNIATEKFEDPTDIDMAVDNILEIPDVIGCEKACGELLIYIQSSADYFTEQNIRSKLENNSVSKFHILRRITQKLCCTGDSVFGGRGTLGGFVRKKILPTVSVKDSALVPIADAASGTSRDDDTLVALVSRHLTQELRLLTCGNIQEHIGYIAPIRSDGEIDILPVDVFETVRRNCDIRFATEHNVMMTVTHLRKKNEIHSLRGANVHILGGRSRPGLGILVGPELRSRNSLRIIVRDRTCTAPFAQEGDSGAMVCYFDPRNGGMLYAVAMVVEIMRADDGSNRVYSAQVVDDALQKLSMWNECEYKFIEDDAE